MHRAYLNTHLYPPITLVIGIHTFFAILLFIVPNFFGNYGPERKPRPLGPLPGAAPDVKKIFNTVEPSPNEPIKKLTQHNKMLT